MNPEKGDCYWCGVWKTLRYLIEPGLVCATCMYHIRANHPEGEGNWY